MPRTASPVPMELDQVESGGSSPPTSVPSSEKAQEVGSFAAKWYSGVVRKVHENGACDVQYDDGDQEDEVPLKFLRAPRKASSKAPAQEQQPAAASSAASADISQGRGKRKIVPTTCMVDGFAVKRQNMYDLDEGEGSVWDRELGEKDATFAGQERKAWDAPRDSKKPATPRAPRLASAAETVPYLASPR